VTGYKIARLRGIGYQEAVTAVYKKAPSLAGQSYADQFNTILSKKLTHAGGFSDAMGILGNHAVEFFYDCETLQRTWAQERGLATTGKDWEINVLIAQLREYRPDVVLFQDIFSMPAPVRARIKEIIPEIRLTIIAKGYPGETRDLSDSDLLFVSSPVLFERYSNLNPWLVYHAFDSGILDCLSPKGAEPILPQSQLSFLGNCRAPERRYWMLKELLDRTSLQIWGVEEGARYSRWGMPRNKKQLKKSLRYYLKHWLSKLGERSRETLQGLPIPKKIRHIIEELKMDSESLGGRDELGDLSGLNIRRAANQTLRKVYPGRFHDPVFGIDYYRRIHTSDIVFNLHSDAAGSTVDNMKMFEITGVGSCLLTNFGSNLAGLFEEDKEVVTYRTVEEALEKIHYLIDNPRACSEIAQAGQVRTLRDHTVSARCEQIDEIIREKL